jgi:hypothetical protein
MLKLMTARNQKVQRLGGLWWHDVHTKFHPMNHSVHKKEKISSPAQQLLASQEGSCSMEIFT